MNGQPRHIEPVILAGGLSSSLLSVRLSKRGRPHFFLTGEKGRCFSNYQLVIDRGTILDIADGLAISPDSILRNGIPLAFTYKSWECDEYEVIDNFFRSDGGRWAIAKEKLDAIAVAAATRRSTCTPQDFSSRMEKNSWRRRIIVNGFGRGAFNRNRVCSRMMVGRYIRFVCRVNDWRIENAGNSHIIDTEENGWLSIVPVSEARLEIVYFTGRGNRRLQSVHGPSLFKFLCARSRILRRLAQKSSLELASVNCGFTILARRASVLGREWMAVGDALFPYDPLAGAGVKFAVQSSRSVGDLVIGGVSSQKLCALNKLFFQNARRFHAERWLVYERARASTLKGEYWHTQCSFSQEAAVD